MRSTSRALTSALALWMGMGCSGDDDDGSSSGAELSFEFADGTTYIASDTPTVSCDQTSRHGLDRMNVSIPVDEAATRYFRLTFVTSLIEKERTWELPYSSGDEDSEMFMFVDGGAGTSSAKGSSGSVTISRATCGDDPELEASFDATLGSQSTGSRGVTVTGEIDDVAAAPDDGGTLIIE